MFGRRRKTKLTEYNRYQAVLTFNLDDDDFVTSLEHDIPLVELMESLTVVIGVSEYYHLSYPRWWGDESTFPLSFPNNIEGTPSQAVLIPTWRVKSIWKQAKSFEGSRH